MRSVTIAMAGPEEYLLAYCKEDGIPDRETIQQFTSLTTAMLSASAWMVGEGPWDEARAQQEIERQEEEEAKARDRMESDDPESVRPDDPMDMEQNGLKDS